MQPKSAWIPIILTIMGWEILSSFFFFLNQETKRCNRWFQGVEYFFMFTFLPIRTLLIFIFNSSPTRQMCLCFTVTVVYLHCVFIHHPASPDLLPIPCFPCCCCFSCPSFLLRFFLPVLCSISPCHLFMTS